jgi:hypothetical protein
MGASISSFSISEPGSGLRCISAGSKRHWQASKRTQAIGILSGANLDQMPAFRKDGIVLIGLQIEWNGGPRDNQSGLHEASIGSNAANQSYPLSGSIHRDWHGVRLKFLPHANSLGMRIQPVGVTQFVYAPDRFQWNNL